ncbi:lipopolysaccharide assembly protein LapA domain-containing protein, partial [Nocardioides sp.]|uniref:lipopolysaccharide assembly protein LapA domain-containing protein n=1 Tax=Nocardioides sp. TaxID=35761 RepID=UPI0035687386
EPTGRATPADTRAAATEVPLRGSRARGIGVGVVVLGIVLVLLIVFISQNTQEVSVTFFNWQGRAPLSVALLAAAAGGLFLTAAAGTLRILQLRRRVRKDKKKATKRV